MGSNTYLVQMLLISSFKKKEVITRNWGRVAPSSQDKKYQVIVEDLFLMEKHTHILKLQELEDDLSHCFFLKNYNYIMLQTSCQ